MKYGEMPKEDKDTDPMTASQTVDLLAIRAAFAAFAKEVNGKDFSEEKVFQSPDKIFGAIGVPSSEIPSAERGNFKLRVKLGAPSPSGSN